MKEPIATWRKQKTDLGIQQSTENLGEKIWGEFSLRKKKYGIWKLPVHPLKFKKPWTYSG